MTTSILPVELQATDQQLRSLRKPMEPHHTDTVKESESAFEGQNVFEWIMYAIVPWWAEGIFEGGNTDSEAEKDYLIGVPLSFIVATTYFGFGTDLGGWAVFGLAMVGAVLTLFGLLVFHILFHKYISMVIYNRLFRRGWMKKMRAEDEAKFQEDVASYPSRLREYEEARKAAIADAGKALEDYHASRPSRRYELGEYGFKQVSDFKQIKDLASSTVRSTFRKLLQR